MHSSGVPINFDWTEYLNLAKELAGKSTYLANIESKLRTAISRAYYAAFCLARNHLRDIDNFFFSHSGQIHRIVINEFKNSTDKRRRQIGNNLNRLRIDRNKVDYADRISNLRKKLSFDLTLADDIISILKTL